MHRRMKRFYSRTNKNKATGQISKHERRERLLRNIRQQQARETAPKEKSAPQENSLTTLGFDNSEALTYSKPSDHSTAICLFLIEAFWSFVIVATCALQNGRCLFTLLSEGNGFLQLSHLAMAQRRSRRITIKNRGCRKASVS